MTIETTLIDSSFIKLDQFLKWTSLAASGSEAKWLIENGKVAVNREVEVRRGRKLYPGDQVALGERVLRIAIQPPEGS